MNNKNQQGQTLIEAIVAIAIIGVALIGFLSQSSYNFAAAKESFNRTVALNLAREGIEVVRNVRDSNWLQGCFDPAKSSCKYWNTGLASGLNYKATVSYSDSLKRWTLHFHNYSFEECVQNKVCLLYLKDNGMYVKKTVNSEPTGFYRQIEIQRICKDESACGGDGICISGQKCVEEIGLNVVSHVTWKQGNNWRNVVLSDRLYNWR
ncbi:prepilin-type N-terminal cleavage/methylation domain-containing protein [Candidatus Kuenenbacteria bacterium]|nr:prepilin-type N-terminal cleavage/methylation domain-containing protein [Candidatus Kuenenbacteria bacterium]